MLLFTILLCDAKVICTLICVGGGGGGGTEKIGNILGQTYYQSHKNLSLVLRFNLLRSFLQESWIFSVCPPPPASLVGSYYMQPPHARAIFYILIYNVKARALHKRKRSRKLNQRNFMMIRKRNDPEDEKMNLK